MASLASSIWIDWVYGSYRTSYGRLMFRAYCLEYQRSREATRQNLTNLAIKLLTDHCHSKYNIFPIQYLQDKSLSRAENCARFEI